MHNPTPVLENDSHKLLWDFTNGSPNPGQETRLNNNQQKKKKENLQNSRLCCPGRPQNKNRKNVKRRINTSTLLGN